MKLSTIFHFAPKITQFKQNLHGFFLLVIFLVEQFSGRMKEIKTDTECPESKKINISCDSQSVIIKNKNAQKTPPPDMKIIDFNLTKKKSNTSFLFAVLQ